MVRVDLQAASLLNASSAPEEPQDALAGGDACGGGTEPGGRLAVPDWEVAVTAVTLSLIILVTIVGNVLVILSVFTYKPLRIVQNFFIVSLAVADLTVAVLVMPFNVAYSLMARWVFGIVVCKMWLTCDVLCCTASILNLCAIALDRYWAITDPINYAQKRTLRRVLAMIAGVWLLSGVISSPPLIGWNDWPMEFNDTTPCQLTEEQGYVIYSSLGSFFIPLFIMTIVYVEIFIATKRRLRERAKASKLNSAMKQQVVAQAVASSVPSHDQESVSSETNHNELPPPPAKEKRRKAKKKNKKKEQAPEEGRFLAPAMVAEDSVTDNSVCMGPAAKNHLAEDGYTCTTTTTTTTTTTAATDSPRSRTASQKGSTAPPTPVQPKSMPVYQFIEEKQRISLSKERRAARTLGIIMGVFVVCWLPFFLMYVIVPFCNPSCKPSPKLGNFITWLGYINSALNPIIYTIFNLDFRRAFKKLLHFKT